MNSYKEQFKKFKKLKELSGNHSPSINQIEEFFPEIKIEVDGCYLSNPYATNLFEKYLRKHMKNKAKALLFVENRIKPKQNQYLL